MSEPAARSGAARPLPGDPLPFRAPVSGSDSVDRPITYSRVGRRRSPKRWIRLPWHAKYHDLLVLADAFMIALALSTTYLAKFSDDLYVRVSGVGTPYVVVAVVVGVLWLAMLAATDSRDRLAVGSGFEEYRRVINASLYTFGSVAVAAYFIQAEVSRIYFVTSLPLGVAALLVGRAMARGYLKRKRKAGKGLTPALILGFRSQVELAVEDMRARPEAGYRPEAVCILDGSTPGFTDAVFDGLNAVELDQVPSTARRDVGAIAVAGGLSREQLKELAWAIENSPVELLMLSELTDVAGPRMSVTSVDGLGLVHVDLPRFSGWSYLVKRLFDVVFSAVALVLVAPILLVAALLIKREDGGPVFFKQQRVGLHGEPFTIHKLRTMRIDAEERVDELIQASGGRALLFKSENDPRVTRIGRFLRRYSIDELPQFWTVLRGHMSVVGPRPQVEREVAEYASHHYRRLLTRPGITGLWQVRGRSNLSIEESLRLDLSYVENWSLTGDLAIILRTLRIVVSSDGAL